MEKNTNWFNKNNKNIQKNTEIKTSVKDILLPNKIDITSAPSPFFQNIRRQTKPKFQTLRFLIFILMIIAIAVGLGCGLTSGSNNPKPVPPIPRPDNAKTKLLLSLKNYINTFFNNASPDKALGIDLSAATNYLGNNGDSYLLQSSSTFNPFKNLDSNPKSNSQTLNSYKGAIQLFNLQIDNINTLSPIDSLKHISGNIHTAGSVWKINVIAQFPFGYYLPIETKSINSSSDRSVLLKNSMEFTYDSSATSTTNMFSNLHFLDTDKGWKINLNLSNDPDQLYFPFLDFDNDNNLDGDSVTNVNMVPFNFSFTSNNQNAISLKYKKFFSDKNFDLIRKSLNLASIKGVSGVRSPYVFSRDFVMNSRGSFDNKNPMINYTKKFFSNLLFSNLKNFLYINHNGNLTSIDKYLYSNIYHSGNFFNPVLNNYNADSWILSGVSPYFQIASDLYNLSDNYNVNNVVAPSDSSKSAVIQPKDFNIPGYEYNSLPNSTFSSTNNYSNFVQPYNLGLYHYYDFGGAKNKLHDPGLQKGEPAYGHGNSAIGAFANNLGFSMPDAGSQNNLNFFDILSATTQNNIDNFNLYDIFGTSKNPYVADYYNKMFASHSKYTGSRAYSFFYDGYHGSNANSWSGENNYLLSVMPRIMLHAYLTWIPDLNSANNNNTINNYFNAQKWALALIIPSNTNLNIQNTALSNLNDNRTAFRIKNNFSDNLWKTQNLDIEISDDSNLPTPENWWATEKRISPSEIHTSNLNEIYHTGYNFSANHSSMSAYFRNMNAIQTNHWNNPMFWDLASNENKYLGSDVYNKQYGANEHPFVLTWVPFNPR